uniref:Reverse transcriptase domain-containing protein n=1 Tax=Tanacetum cinerariifolium TaxID=118510 RepID=A0A6L2J6X8_TANCI|nr:hypothetical protein [Tanacetum cinerariifolium]
MTSMEAVTLSHDGFGVYEIMITDEGVECLASGLRNLVRIDLSKNSLLTDKSMFCLSEKCVRLEEVVFVDCALIKMKGVRFMLDNVRTIEMSVVSGLHGNESLFMDGVRNYSLSDDPVIVLSECLRDLVKARFNFCKLTSIALFALIRNCLSVEHVELSHACLFKEEDVVIDVLKRPNSSIKYLNLSSNSDMSDECLVEITLDCGGDKNLGLRMKPLKLWKLYMGRRTTQRNPRDNIGAMPTGITKNVLGSTSGGPLEINVENPLNGATPSTREQIEGIYRPSGDTDLKKPLKEAVKTSLTWRIIEFTGLEFKMPTNIKLYDGTTDPKDHLSRFSSATNSGEWPIPVWCRMFQETLDGSARGWRRANETLVAFKERWIVKTGFITSVSKVIKISSFMDDYKCPELAKRFYDKVPKTIDEMMMRLDDFVRSEEAFASTELPKGETSEVSRKPMGPTSRMEDRFNKEGYGADRQRNDGRNTFNNRDGLVPYRVPPYQAYIDHGPPPQIQPQLAHSV